MEEFCRIMPKIELHAHLNGSLSDDTLKHLNCDDACVEAYKMSGKTDKTLKECFKLFEIAFNATNNPVAVYEATKCVISEFYFKDNVYYLELRTTPRAEEGMTKEEYLLATISAIQANELDITVKLIPSIKRDRGIEEACEDLNLILEMKSRYPDIVVGIDLSGNPYEGRFEEELFRRAKDSRLRTAIHCGEIQNDKEVKDILEFGPDRIGHGTFLHPSFGGSKDNWELYLKRKTPVECCVTSNVVCGTSKSYGEHHVKEWIQNKLPFCICTDDKGVFNTNLSKEYGIVAEFYSLSKKDLWQVSFDAIDYSFASDEEKSSLKETFMNWYTSNKRMFNDC